MPTGIGRSLREYGARAGGVASQGARSLANLELGKSRVRGQGIRERGAAFASIPQAVAGATGQYLQERREAPLRALQMQKLMQDVALGKVKLAEKFYEVQEKERANAIMDATPDPKDWTAELQKAGLFKMAKVVLDIANLALPLDEAERKREEARLNNQKELTFLGLDPLPKKGEVPPETLEQYNINRPLALANIASPDFPENMRDIALNLWQAETPTYEDIKLLNEAHKGYSTAAEIVANAEKIVNVAEKRAGLEEKNQAAFWKAVAPATPERIPALREFHDPRLSPEFVASIPTDPEELIAYAKGMVGEKAATAFAAWQAQNPNAPISEWFEASRTTDPKSRALREQEIALRERAVKLEENKLARGAEDPNQAARKAEIIMRMANMFDDQNSENPQADAEKWYDEVTKPRAVVPSGKTLDKATATAILEEAGGDKEKARKIASDRGYIF